MSFPAAFGSQLTAIMEALLKAVVAEVTALVEDGAVELRLELRDRDRQILEKEREIEERDRVIEELRAAVEELTAPEEAPVTPGVQEETDGSQQQDWSEEEDDTKPIVKSEPREELGEASPDPHEPLWPPASLCSTSADAAAACSYDEGHTYSSHDADEFSDLGNADMPLESLLDMNQEQFTSAQQHVFSMIPNCNSGPKKKAFGTKQKQAGYRCDQCGKTFTEKRRLKTHQSVHTGAKPYSCQKCGKKFSRRDNCVRHEKSDVRCRDSPEKPNEMKRLLQDVNVDPISSDFN